MDSLACRALTGAFPRAVRVNEKPPKHKPLQDVAREDSDSGEDFADAQVRRALGAAATAPYAARLAAAAGRNAAGAGAYAAASAAAGGRAPAAERGAAALRGMADHVARMRARREAVVEDARRTRAQVAAAASAAVDAQHDFGEAGQRYEFLQSLRSFVRDLCACLEHKVADVEALEAERLSAMKEMCAATRAQRGEVRASCRCTSPGLAARRRCAANSTNSVQATPQGQCPVHPSEWPASCQRLHEAALAPHTCKRAAC